MANAPRKTPTLVTRPMPAAVEPIESVVVEPAAEIEPAPAAPEAVALEPVALEPLMIEAAPAPVAPYVAEIPAPVVAPMLTPPPVVVEAGAQFQLTMRKAAEKTVAESRVAFERVKAATGEAAGSMETSVAAAAKGITEINARAIDAFRSNVASTFDFMKAMTAAKTFSQIMTLQTDHARKQAEIAVSQTKELGALVQKVGAESFAPIKAHLAKTMKLPA